MFKSFIISLCALCLLGCRTQPAAMSSFIDLTGESRQFNDGLIQYQELISISGTLPIPDVGSFYLYPQKSTDGNPFYSIGLNPAVDGYSQVLTARFGTTPGADAAVQEVALAISNYQQLLVNAVSVRVDLAATRARGENTDTLTTRLANIEKEIDDKENEIQEKIIENQLIVARWVVGESRGGQLSVPSLTRVAADQKTDYSGYMIISGLQIRMLVLGPEVALLPSLIDTGNRRLLQNLKVVSFAVQANDIAYTSSLDFNEAISAYLELNPKAIADQGFDYFLNLEKISIQAYAARAGSLDNTGLISGVNWESQPVMLVNFLDVPDALDQRLEELSDYGNLGHSDADTNWYEVSASDNGFPPISEEVGGRASSSDLEQWQQRRGGHVTIYASQIGSSQVVRYARDIDSPFAVFGDRLGGGLEVHDLPEDVQQVIDGRVFVRLHNNDPRLEIIRRMHSRGVGDGGGVIPGTIPFSPR